MFVKNLVLCLFSLMLFTHDICNAEIDKSRLEELKFNALNVGRDYGFINGLEEKKKFYNNKSKELDDIFNFSKLMIEFPYVEKFKEKRDLFITKDNTVLIVPGVLLNVMIKDDSFDLSRSDLRQKPYLLRKTKEGLPDFPSWRNYLFPKFEPNKGINEQVIPLNDEEKKVWDGLYNIGFIEGRKNAFSKVDLSMKTLENVKIGMVVYRQVYGYKIDALGEQLIK